VPTWQAGDDQGEARTHRRLRRRRAACVRGRGGTARGRVAPPRPVRRGRHVAARGRGRVVPDRAARGDAPRARAAARPAGSPSLARGLRPGRWADRAAARRRRPVVTGAVARLAAVGAGAGGRGHLRPGRPPALPPSGAVQAVATGPRPHHVLARAARSSGVTPATQVVDIEGVPVRLTTLERVLWPAVGFTKADMIDFYVAVAPVLLPHVRGRPLTLHRFPEGVDGPSFFQTRAPSHPPWVRVQRMSTFTSGKEVDAVVLDDLAGLVWAANLSAIELHPYLGCAEDLVHPTQVVFDLDPGPPATLVDACRVALLVRSVLEDLGLSSLPKVSGGVGIHVVVPIAPRYPYDETK